MRGWVACLMMATALWGAGAGALAAPGPVIVLTVPVSVSQLHPDITMVRAKCSTFIHDDWRSGEMPQAEGTSAPMPTVSDGTTRSAEGELSVKIAAPSEESGDAPPRTYRCALELYDTVTGAWSDAMAAADRYPLNPDAMSVAVTGGYIKR